MPHYNVTPAPKRGWPPMERSRLLAFTVAVWVAVAFTDETFHGGGVLSGAMATVCGVVAVWIAVRCLPHWWRTRCAANETHKEA